MCTAWIRCSLQKGVKLIAVADTVLFVLSVAASVVVEQFVCHRRPIKISIYLTGSEFKENVEQNGTAIWDYLTNSYDKITTCVPSLSYVIFTSFIVFMVGYLVLEIWMCCLLVKGASRVCTTIEDYFLPVTSVTVIWREHLRISATVLLNSIDSLGLNRSDCILQNALTIWSERNTLVELYTPDE